MSATAAGLATGLGSGAVRAKDVPAKEACEPDSANRAAPNRRYNTNYAGPRLNRVAFPLGGLGTGMICLEGTGALSHVSVRNKPDLFNEPCMFAAISVRGPRAIARVLEGPVPGWKLFGMRGSGSGEGQKSLGLPRFKQACFTARFPFGTVSLTDPDMPLTVELTGWSPFTPGDADSSSLPVAALEYRFTNTSHEAVDAVFSFSAKNFLVPPASWPPPAATTPHAVRPADGGFMLWTGATAESPWNEAAFATTVDDPAVQVNHTWFRGSGFDPLTMAWKDVAAGACFDRPPPSDEEPVPGATLFVPLQLAPGASRTIALRLCWYAGVTNVRHGWLVEQKPNDDQGQPTYKPWYAGQFPNIAAIARHWRDRFQELRARSALFTETFYGSTLPPEVLEAVAANLSILKSPTVLRQADGRLWAWEGSQDDSGCCDGSCTHVWNYAQAIPHLFPQLERTLRETEFGPNQDERGRQQFRAALPIRPVSAHFHPAADGQLGGIMKVHRDWRISGDTVWLRRLWPKVRKSLDYCIELWDPNRKGWVEEPHHNTYDIEFWGPDGMCTSIYLGALQATVSMGRALNDDVSSYRQLLERGCKRTETELFDGEYFFQKVEWKNLRAGNPVEFKGWGSSYSTEEARALLEKEGPMYQYGAGCLSDGVLGAWLALVCGVGQVLDPAKVASHLRAVHRYNLKKDLSTHVNPQRPGYAAGAEGGLLLCTWPKGGALSLPFVYSNEVWTGIEYQMASHLMMMGLLEEGLEIVRICRNRYDGRVRNPFDEYECGRWYARALSSYGLLQGLSGARYDAVEKILYLQPSIKGDFRCFLSTVTGYGSVGVKDGKPFLEVVSGTIPFKNIHYTAAV